MPRPHWSSKFTQTLDASRERVFKALTDRAELVRWWGPSGFTTPEIEMDLSLGGSYRWGMQPPDGELFHLAGEFLEIDPPHRLAYSFRWEEPGDAAGVRLRASHSPACCPGSTCPSRYVAGPARRWRAAVAQTKTARAARR